MKKAARDAGARKARSAARGASGLAPPVKESFDQLARKAAAAEPRRGSMMQPPPAWRPDEVTLGFAMVADESGQMHELPEPTLLATILVAVESDRHRLVHRLTGRADEEIEAVANLFWPLIVLPGRKEPEVAIFDGTGVWRRTFRYTLLPNLDEVTKLLSSELPPAGFLERLRALLPQFSRDPGAEELTVEGFLPIDPPLLFDVLSHSDFRSDPQSPHAGFLPARHDVLWHQQTMQEMYRWLDRFDADLQKLQTVREQAQATVKATETRLGEEYARLQAESRQRIQEATTRSEAEIARLHQAARAEIQRHLAAVRQAQAKAAHGEVEVATSETLAFRATHRRSGDEAHQVRRRAAETAVRNANRDAAEGRKAIERVHAEERAALDRELANVAALERQTAQTLGERELFRDDAVAAGFDLLQAIDGQIAARSSQKNLLAGYFLPVGSLTGVQVVWFPLWVATLRGSRGLRQLVFPPMQVRNEKRLAGALKQFFGGVVLPVEPRTAQFDTVLRTTMEDALRKDPWLSTATAELTRAADVLSDPDVLQRLQQGLADLGRDGWVTEKQQKSFLTTYVERAERRAKTGVSQAPVPRGATSEPFPPSREPERPAPPR